MMANAETGRSTRLNKDFENVCTVLNIRKEWRQLTNFIQKCCNKKWAVIFNRACIRENLIPSYLKNI